MIIYLFIINALGFIIMLYDKNLAKNHQTRVPESSLFAIAVFGGSIGIWLAMYTVRHKKRHISFRLGIPAIIGVQFLLAFFIWYLF